MSVPKHTRWQLDPHTVAKHEILRNYLDAWFPILLSNNGRVVYIDGFAGPGEYTDGQRGSPMIALEAARNCRVKTKGQLVFWFIEQKAKRLAHLKNCIEALQLPANFDVNIHQGTFAEDLTEVLDGLDADSVGLAPTFALVDPFGFARIPYTLIKRLLEQRKCEVLINIMVDSMNRFLTHPNDKVRAAIAEAFGTHEAIDIAFGSGNRVQALKDLYLRQLKSGARFVRHFEMRNKKDRVIYYLFFASNNATGHEKMKDAMWKVDPRGEFTFSDATNPEQQVLFVKTPSIVPLANALIARFAGSRQMLVSEVQNYVSVDTFYLPKHMRAALQQLESDGRVSVAAKKVDGTPRRANTFPPGTLVAFAPVTTRSEDAKHHVSGT